MKETSHPPPGSKLFGFFVIPQKERHTREETEKLKSWKLKRKVDKRKRGEEEDRRSCRYIEGFQSSEPSKKGKNRQICIFAFHSVAEYRDV